MVVLAALIACTGAPTPPVEPPVVDCAVPWAPFELGAPLQSPRANRSLAIAGDSLVGWNGTSLVRATSPTDATLFVPNVTAFGGMVFLEDGTFVVSEHLGTENVLRVAPGGGPEILARSLRAYGVVVGPDGRVYATAEPDTIYRIDAATGAAEPWLVFPADALPRVADFSPSGDRLYVGTRNEDGRIYAVDVDADANPVGEPTVFTSTPGDFHDVLVADACGRLLVTAFGTAGVYRVLPDGTVETLAELDDADHVHGAAWGSGVGSWDDHTLYLARPNRANTVTAWAIGVPGRDFNGGDYEVVGLD
ncbi:MAG: SMP-30/gluconolactonase/LRE family protein [Alphaproteobacteria bacterium]|nr:SMP-30/gluconolactonase/LRE family protein [Alphaproteobacteria bacterium]